jgi:GT2 family glycosyltransferase
MDKKPMCTVIIVTHNSERFLDKVLKSLDDQTRQPNRIVIVDSGSKDTTYLKAYSNRADIEIIFDNDDIGFCRANNVAMKHVNPSDDYILFLNPDAFLFPPFIEQALNYMEKPENYRVGVLTGSLLGYDITADRPTGKYDSTGIYRKWYGRWYDRAQGESTDKYTFLKEEEPLAICGALMFCRQSTLKTIMLRDGEVFDNTFYMYKDDIDLSLRIRRKGWKLKYLPFLQAYHCRGWSGTLSRKKVPRKLRLYSAKNELRIHLQERSLCSLYSLAKYTAVKLFNV